MAIAEHPAGRQSPFERVLDELDEDDSPATGAGAAPGADRLWPRASAPIGQGCLQSGAIENLYAESQIPRETLAPEKPKKTMTATNFAEIHTELAAAKNLDELRRLRRRCALSAHPDLVAPKERPVAEKFMAEINAAIDRAIKAKRF
ncbi:hypothetical protein [Rhodoblastus sp.]|uniref:hypothetical protein n=1 Tax=Rhodoblastus sp. TaxID=1962975 RepID=UPI003F94E182